MRLDDMPDFDLPPLESYEAYVEPGVTKPQAQPKDKADRKKKREDEESPQFLFSRYLLKAGKYKSSEGMLYEWTGTHWRALTGQEPERMALEWLFNTHPGKASDKLAASCSATAALSLPLLPTREYDEAVTLIPCKSGTLKVTAQSVTLRPSHPEDGLTYCLACAFDPFAPRPLFNQFILGALPDESVREWLQEYSGYTLTGDTRHQIAAWLIGGGGNGKGTYVTALSALHSKVAAAHIGNGEMNGFGMENLVGASLILVDETPTRIDEQRLKTLISGDAIRVDRKYRDPITLRSRGKWIVNGNSLPSISDQSDGFWRRWVIIRFDYKPTKLISLLGDRIAKEELSGLLNWTLAGLQRLLQRGNFPVLPESLEAEKKKARLAANSVALWMDDSDVSILDKPEDGPLAGMPKKSVYFSYHLWCKSNGMIPVNSPNFWQRLQTQHPTLRYFRRGSGHDSSRVWCANLHIPVQHDK